ncbi:MAG: zinc-binding dehydrogenase [Actinobacteria bacterium]|nr:zinc-binding dehydrogenase [Actinomycetota bacterium]
MKAAVVEKPGILSIKEVPEPKINEYQALVEILACATCNSTDRKLINGELPGPFLNFPGILGHESVGRVIEVGGKVRNYKIGDLVLRPVAVYPGEKLGNYYSLFGGFSEFGVVTDYEAEIVDKNKKESDFTLWHLYQQTIPPYFDPIDSTMLITFREVLDWSYRFGINNRTKLVILGSGPVAMSFVIYSKMLGAYPVIVVGLRDERLRLTTDLGADFVINSTRENVKDRVFEYTGGTGATHIVEAIGKYELINETFGYLQKGGMIGIYGATSPKFVLNWEDAPPTWILTHILQDERVSHQQVINSVKMNFVNPKKFYSHVVSLENINDGFRLLEEKKALKVVVKIK